MARSRSPDTERRAGPLHDPQGESAGAVELTGVLAPDHASHRPSPLRPETATSGDRRLLEGTGAVLAPTALVTALAFYFGWARTNALVSYFGIDPSMLGFSTQDYLLRSADVLFAALAGLLVFTLAAYSAHCLVRRKILAKRRGRALQLLTRLACVLGVGLAALGVIPILPLGGRLSWFNALLELGPALGVSLLGYSTYVGRPVARHGLQPTSSSTPLLVLLGMVAVLSVFWAAANYADTMGREHAELFAQELPTRPAVVVDTRERLRLDTLSGDVAETRTGDNESAYRFRTTGLRLFIHSGGKYFLLPAHWSSGHGVVIVLSDNDAVRLEFVTPGKR